MKTMKSTAVTSLLVALCFSALGATNLPPTFMNGDMNIRFNTKTQTDASGSPVKGVADSYSLYVNVTDSVRFRGTISHLPYIIAAGGMFSSDAVVQRRSLNYNLTCDVVNPQNTSQVRSNIGRVFGVVPIGTNGVYYY